MKIRATIAAPTTSSAWGHGDIGFRTVTSRRRWCCRNGINNFLWSLLRFVVDWSKPQWRTSENKCAPSSQLLVLSCEDSDQSSWFFGVERRKTQERKSFSTPPVGMLAVVRWASVLRPFAECLPVRSSIWSVIQVWIWDLELFTAWVQVRWKSVSRYLCNLECLQRVDVANYYLI